MINNESVIPGNHHSPYLKLKIIIHVEVIYGQVISSLSKENDGDQFLRETKDSGNSTK